MTVKGGRYICEGCDGECNLIIQAGCENAPYYCPMGGHEATQGKWMHINDWRAWIKGLNRKKKPVGGMK